MTISTKKWISVGIPGSEQWFGKPRITSWYWPFSQTCKSAMRFYLGVVVVVVVWWCWWCVIKDGVRVLNSKTSLLFLFRELLVNAMHFLFRLGLVTGTGAKIPLKALEFDANWLPVETQLMAYRNVCWGLKYMMVNESQIKILEKSSKNKIRKNWQRCLAVTIPLSRKQSWIVISSMFICEPCWVNLISCCRWHRQWQIWRGSW